MAVGCRVKQLSCQGYHQLSTVSIPLHFDHFEALNHHFIDEPHGGNLIKADRGYIHFLAYVNTWPSSVVSRVNTYPMQFLLSYEAHVSSLSLLHFEDSIEAVDQISDKEPEGVQNSSGAENDTIVATPS